TVLQAFAEIADPDIHVPEPKQKACRLVWKLSGYVGGDGWSLAWRTVDAQYWGVPQRRRRIYLVVDLGGECADEILFERTGVSGNSEPCGAAREETAGDVGRSVEGKNCDGCLNPWDSQTIRQYDARGVFPALVSNATGGQNRQGIVYPTIARTLTAEHDASPCIDRGYNIVAAFMGGQGAKARSVAYCDDGTTPTLKAALSGGNTVTDVVYSIQGNRIDRDAKQNGDGVSVDIAHTINRVDRHGVCAVYDTTQITSPQNGSKPQPGDPCHPLAARQHPNAVPPRKYIIRRLTPLECCRLQGFPDWWEDGVEGSDSARYKMWGNGMALPNMLHVMKGIVRMQEDRTLWVR
ncbi:MAG: DNA cytosine methyltransferase, partial [Kiritimatiellae bacterium]|nr:DNA cytosine methyltransferase [Kiritimatiellia bacterium]